MISVIRNVVEVKGGQRVRYLSALTPYRGAESHRMMEGALLVLP